MDALSNLKSFLTMGFKLGGAFSALADGFQLLKDVGPLLEAAKAIPGGIASAPAALSEYLNMSDEQALPLEDWVVATFDIPNDAVEVAIEQALKVVIELHSLAKFLKPKA